MAVDDSALKDEIIRLGPWHLDVEVTPEVSTRVALEAPPDSYPDSFGPVSFVDARESWKANMRRIYPDGLEGRAFLDCACNCGGYVFWAKELGAGRCFGFDVHDHWIKQARFLLEHRTGPRDDVRFETRDLYDLPKIHLEPFDVTLFKGIFYHLPDPITGLKIAADLTKELMIVGTATRSGLPDGLLAIDQESDEWIMSGVYGLNWLPTGPDVLDRILRWVGFVETRMTGWLKESRPGTRQGRMQMIASKRPGLLDALDGAG
jgi:tRNA (mo5U34)-methyltransferase